MKTNILSLILFSAIATSCVSQKAVTINNTGEEAAITAAIKTLETGWNEKSGEIFASRFSEIIDYIIWDGTFVPGMTKADNIRGHQSIFDGIYRNSEIHLEVAKLNFFRKDLAQASVYGWNYQKGAERPEEALLLMTMILDKSKGDWEIVSFHNADVHVGRMSDRNARQWYADQEILIKEEAQSMVDGWNARDANAMCESLAEVCSFSVSNEGYMPSATREELISSHKYLFENVFTAKGAVNVKETTVRFLDGELAQAEMIFEEPSRDNPEVMENNLAQLVLKRSLYGKWQITSFYLAPMNLRESR